MIEPRAGPRDFTIRMAGPDDAPTIAALVRELAVFVQARRSREGGPRRLSPAPVRSQTRRRGGPGRDKRSAGRLCPLVFDVLHVPRPAGSVPRRPVRARPSTAAVESAKRSWPSWQLRPSTAAAGAWSGPCSSGTRPPSAFIAHSELRSWTSTRRAGSTKSLCGDWPGWRRRIAGAFLNEARAMSEDFVSMTRFVLPHIARMAGYVPGEQPQGGGFIKLNTNENPYPPSPRVKAALAEAIGDRLRLYPDPLSTVFRQAAARLHGVTPEMVMAGNGSDDLLTILTRAFVGPGDLAAFPSPSYLLYSTLVALQDGRSVVVPYQKDWSLDWNPAAFKGVKVFWLANPDSPSGTALAARRSRPTRASSRLPARRRRGLCRFRRPAAPFDSAHRKPRECDRHPLVQQRVRARWDSPGLPGRASRDRRTSEQDQRLVQLRHAQPGRGSRGPI